MSIQNALPNKINVATENTNGLMSADDKIAVNKINRMELDLNDKMNKNTKIKSSQLDISSDSAKIQPENLSDAVKKMMTGKTPVSPELAKRSITTDYLADNAVTSEKRTANGSIAIIVSDEYCNFDTSGDTEVVLSIPGNYSVYYGNKVLTFENTPESVTLEKGIPSVITYSVMEGFSAYNQEAIKEQDYLVGAFDGKYVTMFNGRYTVDGFATIADDAISGSSIKDFTMDPKKIAVQVGQIISDRTDGPYINLNYKSKFIEAVKSFDFILATQAIVTVKKAQECVIPDNTDNKSYLFIYYNLGDNKLTALWGNTDITKTIISNGEKLILLGVVDYSNERPVSINHEFIAVNSRSPKVIDIEYIDMVSGYIQIDLKAKKITANGLKAFIDDDIVSLLQSDSQIINILEDQVTNIVNGIPYTIAARRLDFDKDAYELVFDKTENIKSLGLDTLYITSIKEYNLSNNKDFITFIKTDGNVVKSLNMISDGYILPMDDTTVILNLTTEIEEGNMILKSTTVPGSTIVDANTNIKYNITKENVYQTVITDLHGLYSILFNTNTNKIEVLQLTNDIDRKVYISLGFVNELSDSLAYSATGEITDHILLNSTRPSNYKTINGPDPDKGYDWLNNRLVIPNDLYLLANTQYTLYCQNMSMDRYIDNDYINYEIALPTNTAITENAFTVNSPVSGVFDSMIAGKFKGNNNVLYKDISLHFAEPQAKDLTVLCIGDDTVDMNMPGYISKYLKSYGYNPTMLGTVKNSTDINGYGMQNLEAEYGEGHKGWRLTDFMCRTKHTDGSPYYMQNNPFMNNSKFDFEHYMTSNSYDSVDVVVISVGLNDIIGYHTASTLEDIQNLTIYQNIEQLPNIYKEMISNIHKYDSNIKIIINPTMIKGVDDEFNKKSLLLTETLLYDLKDIQNVFYVAGYLSQPIFTGINKNSIAKYETSSSINNTKLGSLVSTTDINGMSQSNLAFMIVSAIINITKTED